jgi:hypothetical protein
VTKGTRGDDSRHEARAQDHPDDDGRLLGLLVTLGFVEIRRAIDDDQSLVVSPAPSSSPAPTPHELVSMEEVERRATRCACWTR